jgi:hypothetical protein
MSAIELRTLVAAQIVTAMSSHLAPNSADSQIKEVAETAVKIAKAIEEAAARSLEQG